MRKECPICLYARRHFFHLSCCDHHVCHPCIQRLERPLCPYCRHIIEARSTPFAEGVDELIPPSIIPNSRIMQRQLRRIHRRRLREHDRERNRRLSRVQRQRELFRHVLESMYAMIDAADEIKIDA